ncbi:MBL fold metallo-hydrolase [Sabulicella rubraurantiaca]|uniref:MBL fold metallo-hydrolase n=1 Tax=Sabulicella rubraurantiaca TaxID=2811429 RepID=UPI001A97CF5A|nr:MBL fold metallo-hydrolase [Sabulicella rubraurantiaca]
MKELRVGDVSITSVIERDGPWRRPEDFFLGYDSAKQAENIAKLQPEVFDRESGKMVITYQTFIVRTARHVILVDTCTGEDKGYGPPMDFPKQRWLDELAAAGLNPEDVDYVFCTHLHIDHSGWNTKLENGRWVPFFPRAKYVFHKGEYEAWEKLDQEGVDRPGGAGGVWRMNCKPIVEAGQALLVEEGFEIEPGISLMLTAGHSACHCCLRIERGGKRALITGDMFHHQLQCSDPELSTIFCWDPEAARATRRKVFSEVAGTDTVLLPIHFPSPTAGRLKRSTKGYAWEWAQD